MSKQPLSPEERLKRRREYSRRWYRANKEKCARWSKEKFARNPEKHRAHVRTNYLDKTFGPGGAAHYERMFAEQGGRCAICGEPPRADRWGRLHQDHDTACCPYDRKNGRKSTVLRTCGECRRGLLCNNCNAALAGLERAGWLRKALRYLKRWSKTETNRNSQFLDTFARLRRRVSEG